jgi:hypothetical protein
MAKRIFSCKSWLVVLLLAGTANAHHGWTWYTGEALELTGKITEARWGNPHDRLMLQVSDQTWDVWLGPPSRNKRAGFHQGVVEVGDQVTVFGHRHVDGKRFEMKTERIRVGEDLFNMYPERE